MKTRVGRRIEWCAAGVVCAVGVLGAAACGSANDAGIAMGDRLLTGRIHASPATRPTGQRISMQVAAYYAAVDCAAPGIVVGAATGAKACAIFGEPFDPGEQGGGQESQPFHLEVPCALTVNLVVQTLGSSDGRSPGGLLALLAYPDDGPGGQTSLLATDPMCPATPKMARNLLDLGAITVPGEPTASGVLPTVIVGGPDGGQNPLATIDTDGDFMPNAADSDDDGDGIPDATDPDADGDRIPDAAQIFDAAWLAAAPT